MKQIKCLIVPRIDEQAYSRFARSKNLQQKDIGDHSKPGQLHKDFSAKTKPRSGVFFSCAMLQPDSKYKSLLRLKTVFQYGLWFVMI